MEYKIIQIAIILIFAFIMWAITKVVKTKTGKEISELIFTSKNKTEKQVKPHNKSWMEKYCNDQKNDSRRALAHYILIHEDNERKKRGQIDD